MKQDAPKLLIDTMTTRSPLSSDASSLLESNSAEHEQSSSAQQGLCLAYDEAMKELPVFLQPTDDQEKKDLAMFLSQVDKLHKPVAGKLSARFVFNFLEHMLKPATPITKEPTEVIVPDQLQETTENIAFEIINNVINDFNLHDTTTSVLNVLQEVSWETKAALSITTFVLTFGDNGLNLCKESKVSIDEIQMFAKLKDNCEMDGSDNIFRIIYKLIGSVFEFEVLPAAYMSSKDPEVKVARTQLIVIVYWIIRTITAASTSHIMKLYSRRNEFDKAILGLRKLSSPWYKKLKDLGDKDYLNAILSKLQDLLKKDVDIEAYNKIKEIVEKGNHSENMEVLNVLFSSTEGDVHPLYDCVRKRKVHLDELKGTYVLLYISSLEHIAPEVNETKLNEFIDSFDLQSKSEVECKLVWMPIVEKGKSLQHKKATNNFMVKPLLDLCYVVHQKLNPILELEFGPQKNFKDWYSIGNPSRITNEVKKLLKDDWKYNGEPMLVVLDPQGNVVHHNAIQMLLIWGITAFPFTREREEYLWKKRKYLQNFEPIYIAGGLRQLHDNWYKGMEYYFWYGGANMEWIRSFTGLVGEVARELGVPIHMVYVGRNHNLELVRSVKEENLSHCLSDKYYIWLFWKRLESIIYSGTLTGRLNDSGYDKVFLQSQQMLLNYDKSNVGWAILRQGPYQLGTWHGKVVVSTLKEFKLWKEKALDEGFRYAFKSHYNKLYKKILPCKCLEYPTDALQQAPLETRCPDCGNQMEKYTTFICYHPPPTRGSDDNEEI